MSTSTPWIFGVGILAQALFAARMIVQWVLSEKARKSLSPVIFWQLSIIGSLFFLLYGILRHDFAIVLGQVLVYFIYLRNLHLKERWHTIPTFFKIFVILAPVITAGFFFLGPNDALSSLLTNKDISTPLKVWGSVGQLIFTLRFFVQWIESESKNESVMSQRFWIVSLIGASMITIYAIFRHDPVLFFGQVSGLVVYIRNLSLVRIQTAEK